MHNDPLLIVKTVEHSEFKPGCRPQVFVQLELKMFWQDVLYFFDRVLYLLRVASSTAVLYFEVSFWVDFVAVNPGG